MQNLHEILEIVETVGLKVSQEYQLSQVIFFKSGGKAPVRDVFWIGMALRYSDGESGHSNCPGIEESKTAAIKRPNGTTEISFRDATSRLLAF